MNKTVDNDEESQFLSQEGLMINHDKYVELLPQVILGIVHEWGLDTKPIKRFQRTLTLEELQQITDRKVGTNVDASVMGVTKIPETPVAAPVAPQPAPQPQPAAPVQPQVAPTQPMGDPLEGVAA